MSELPHVFRLEDERHSDDFGEFATRTDAIAALVRLAQTAWDEKPNVAPCTNWRNCGRSFELVECEIDGEFRRELSRWPALDVTAEGVSWADGFAPED